MEADKKAAEHDAWRALLAKDHENGERCARKAELNAKNAQHWLMEEEKHKEHANRKRERTKGDAGEEVNKTLKKFKSQSMDVEEQDSPEGEQKEHSYNPAVFDALARQDTPAPGVRNPHLAECEDDADGSQHSRGTDGDEDQPAGESVGSSPQNTNDHKNPQQDGCHDHRADYQDSNDEMQQDNEPDRHNHVTDINRLQANSNIPPEDNHQEDLDKDGDAVTNADVDAEGDTNMEPPTPEHEEQLIVVVDNDDYTDNVIDDSKSACDLNQGVDDAQEDADANNTPGTEDLERPPHRPATSIKTPRPALYHHSEMPDQLDQDEGTVTLGHGRDDDVDNDNTEEQVVRPTTSIKRPRAATPAAAGSDHGESKISASRDTGGGGSDVQQYEVIEIDDSDDDEASNDPSSAAAGPSLPTLNHDRDHSCTLPRPHEQDLVPRHQDEGGGRMAHGPQPALPPGAPRLSQDNIQKPPGIDLTAQQEAINLEALVENNDQRPLPDSLPPSSPPPPPPRPPAHRLDHPRKVHALDEEIADSQDQDSKDTQVDTQLDDAPRIN